MPADPPSAGGGRKSTAPSSATSTESGHRQAAVEGKVRVAGLLQGLAPRRPAGTR